MCMLILPRGPRGPGSPICPAFPLSPFSPEIPSGPVRLKYKKGTSYNETELFVCGFTRFGSNIICSENFVMNNRFFALNPQSFKITFC